MEEKCVEKRHPYPDQDDWIDDQRKREERSTFLEKSTVCNRFDTSQFRVILEGLQKYKLDANNILLRDRIQELQCMLHKLNSTVNDLLIQEKRILDVKDKLQQTIADTVPLLEANKEVLTLRDARRDIDLVNDATYKATKDELQKLTSIHHQFVNDIDSYFPVQLELAKLKFDLMEYLKFKEDDLNTTKHCLNLTPFSEECTYKPWPDDLPFLSNINEWLRCCEDKINAAKEGIDLAIEKVSLSEDLICDLKNEIRKIKDNTENNLRLKIQELNAARDSLKKQRKMLQKQIDTLEFEKKQLERTNNQNGYHRKLIQTRLEYLKSKPFEDIKLQAGLLEENDQLKEFHNELEVFSQDNKILLNDLYKQLFNVEKDLMQKENCLMIEKTCLDRHMHPSRYPYKSELGWLDLSDKSKYTDSFIRRHMDARELADRKIYEKQSNIPYDFNDIDSRFQGLNLNNLKFNRFMDNNHDGSHKCKM